MNRFLVQACSLSIIYNHEFVQTLKMFKVHILNVTFRPKKIVKLKLTSGQLLASGFFLRDYCSFEFV